jgi:small-conductance mechanosensitive channel
MEDGKNHHVRFDGVVTAGNLLSLLGMVGAVISSVFYVAVTVGHEEERITAETTLREKSIEALQQQLISLRAEESERFVLIGRRIDESVEAERAIIAQINAALNQINARLDAAIMGARVNAPEH